MRLGGTEPQPTTWNQKCGASVAAPSKKATSQNNQADEASLSKMSEIKHCLQMLQPVMPVAIKRMDDETFSSSSPRLMLTLTCSLQVHLTCFSRII